MNGGREHSSAHNTRNFPSAKPPRSGLHLRTLHLALAGAVTVLKPSCFSREGRWLSQAMQRSKASITHRLLGDTPREKAVETGPSPVPQPRAPTGDVITRLCSAGSEN